MSITGIGASYEFVPIKRLYFELGGATLLFVNRLYVQSKYAVYQNKKIKVKLGADLSYIKTNVFGLY